MPRATADVSIVSRSSAVGNDAPNDGGVASSDAPVERDPVNHDQSQPAVVAVADVRVELEAGARMTYLDAEAVRLMAQREDDVAAGAPRAVSNGVGHQLVDNDDRVVAHRSGNGGQRRDHTASSLRSARVVLGISRLHLDEL